MSDTGKWVIAFDNDRTEAEYDSFSQAEPKRKDKFEADVTTNPYTHQVKERIRPLKGAFEGLFRWSQSNTRVVYKPHKDTKTIYPLEMGTATNISYKKRSSRKRKKR